MCPIAFGAGITAAQAYSACGSALGNRGYSSAVAGRIDTAISSRAGIGDAMSLNASAMSHIQTAMTNQGYTAARGAKLDKLDTSISSRAKTGDAMSINASGISHIGTALTNQGLTTTRAGYLDNIMKDIEDAVGSLVMDGSELTVKEFTALTQRMDCYIDLSVLQAGDTVVLKQYMKIKSGGSYRAFGSETHADAQTVPLVYTEIKPAKYGFKITLQQTAGTNRTIDWQTFKQVKSG